VRAARSQHSALVRAVTLKILAWNIRQGGSATQALAPAIVLHNPDVIVLCEFREKSQRLLDELRFLGWPHSAASPVEGPINGVAIASKLPLQTRPAPFGESPFDRWGVEAGVSQDLTVVGVYAPLADSLASSPAIQREFWGSLHRIAEDRKTVCLLLIGDFNTGATGTDCPLPLPCGDAFEHLSTIGWVDAWRLCNPDQNDFSYVHHANGETSNWRIDHAFVSPPLVDAVRRCWYSHTERERWGSDHSMLLIHLDDRPITTA
jgi:exonuclease III